jgi:hypothetical protein
MRSRSGRYAFVSIAAALLELSVAPVAGQEVALESATLGATGHISGSSLASAQYIGWRFQINSPLDVDAVSGHMYESDPGGLFAAIVSLPSINAVPAGAPINPDELVASTTFQAPFPSTEVTIPLTASLQPGSYVLIYGTNLFGATGAGAMPNFNDQPDIPPTDISSYIFWSRPFVGQPFEWRQNLGSHMRFVLKAHAPIPGDYNHDGTVDAADYNLWQADFGSTTNFAADGNANGAVDAADYTIWRDHLGEIAGGPGAAAAVPEPSAIVLCLIGGLAAGLLIAAQKLTGRAIIASSAAGLPLVGLVCLPRRHRSEPQKLYLAEIYA